MVLPLIFGIGLLLLAPLALRQGMREIKRARASRDWLSTNATIVNADVKSYQTKVGHAWRTEYRVDVTYEYAPISLKFTSDRIRSDEVWVTFGNSAQAWEYIEALESKQPLIAWYDPLDPSLAALERGAIAGPIIWFWTAFLLLVFGAFAVFIGWPIGR